MIPHGEDFQRLDYWLWCARLLKTRAACARHVTEAGLRINRQPTAKPHARVRPGDVLTFATGSGTVRVLRVRALAQRRGPAAEARALFDEIPDAPPPLPVVESGGICASPAGSGQRALGTIA